MVSTLKKKSSIAIRNRRKWLHAQLFLAWIGFLHFAKKLFVFSKKNNLEKFKTNYFPEGYTPVSLELRVLAHEPGRCLACGLCDAACPESLSPMRMLLDTHRAPHPNPLPEGEGIENCASCNLCEQACPEQIPIIKYISLAEKTFY